MSRPVRVTALFAGLGVATVVVACVSAGTGQFAIPLSDVVASLLHRFGIGPGLADPFAEGTLWQVRFPRVVLALLVGGVLGVSGALMQGLFGNPLAEPAVVGVSAGAAVGASLSIVAGWVFLGAFTTPALGFAGGLLTTLAVYGLRARAAGRRW